MPLGFKILVELGLTVSKSIAPYWLVDGFRFLRPIFTSEGKGSFYGQNPHCSVFNHYAKRSLSGNDPNNEKVRICFQSVAIKFSLFLIEDDWD